MLNKTLLDFGEGDTWTVKDACEGTQIFGGTGSGKTSGSGQAIAKAFLNNGLGGLVLTVKGDEKLLWQKYARETGREDDLVIISANTGISDNYFNFLQYEYSQAGRGSRITENLVNLFIAVISTGSGAQNVNSYWSASLKQLLRNTIDLIALAKDRVSLMDMYLIVLSSANSREEVDSEIWRQDSICYKMLKQAKEKLSKNPNDKLSLDLEITERYWLNEFPNLDEKTRSIIVSMFTSKADCFLRGTLRDIFCNDQPDTFTPEDTFEGKILVIDLPKKEYDELGQYAQVLIKYIWQRAVERRKVEESTNPVFLWVDEAQHFYTEHDSLFQTTARSSRACTVYITQNIPNYEAVFYQGNSKAKVNSFLGNLQTKIFHANSDVTTNEYASSLISKSYKTYTSSNSGNQGQSYSTSRVLEHQIIPKEFAELKNGGPENQNQVEAILYQTGRVWHSENNFSKQTFSQG